MEGEPQPLPSTMPMSLQVQVPHQGLVVGLQGLKGPVVAVPGRSEQSGLHVLALDGAVEGAEAVHHGLQLGGHAVVVQGRGEHQHIRIQNFSADALHIVLLDAGALVAAVDAAGAGVDISVGHVDELHGVAGLLRPLAEAVRQNVGGAVSVGAAL